MAFGGDLYQEQWACLAIEGVHTLPGMLWMLAQVPRKDNTDKFLSWHARKQSRQPTPVNAWTAGTQKRAIVLVSITHVMDKPHCISPIMQLMSFPPTLSAT